MCVKTIKAWMEHVTCGGVGVFSFLCLGGLLYF